MKNFDHYDQSIHRRHPAVVGVTLSCILLLAACSDGDKATVTPVTPPATNSDGTSTTTNDASADVDGSSVSSDVIVPPSRPQPPEGQESQPEEQTPTEGGVGSVDTGGMFPEDREGDDLPSLIVTGLNGADPNTVVSPWLASAVFFRLDSQTPGTGDGDVAFFNYTDQLPVSEHIKFYSQELEVCKVSDPRKTETGNGSSSGSPPPRVSAGQSITVNSASGPWFTFNRGRNKNDQWEYTTNNELPSALPEGATLSIPGDEFPAVQAYPLYEPQAPIRLLPNAGENLSSASAYAWVPGNSKTYMTIDFLSFDDEGKFAGFAGYCRLIDDGAFDMPEDVKKFIDEIDLDINARYVRSYERVDYADNIVFRQLMLVSE